MKDDSMSGALQDGRIPVDWKEMKVDAWCTPR